MKNLPRYLASVCFVLLLTSFGFAGETSPCQFYEFVPTDLLSKLVDAKSAQELTGAYAKYAFHYAPEDIFYAVKLYGFEPTEEHELLVLVTAPSSPIEFELWYGVCNSKFKEWPILNETFFKYFDLVAALAAKHPEYMRAVFVQDDF